jgi:hypothetical protein
MAYTYPSGWVNFGTASSVVVRHSSWGHASALAKPVPNSFCRSIDSPVRPHFLGEDEMPSNPLPTGKNSNNPLYTTFIVIGVLGAIASFSVGGGSPAGGFVAAGLNPLVWLGIWSFFRLNQIRCPHCGKNHDRNIFDHVPAESECACLKCKHGFLKPLA